MQRRKKIFATISALFARAEIPKKITREILDDDAILYLDEKLRHVSFDERNNYELDEFIGDSVINLVVARYVVKHFYIAEESEATIIKHRIQSNKYLGGLAEKYMIVDLILINVPVTEKIKGDAFEALVGCLIHIIEKKKLASTAYIICTRIIDSLLGELSLEKNVVTGGWKDPVSFFKENYLDHYWEQTGGSVPRVKNIKQLIVETKNPDDTFTAKVYGYPNGSRERALLGEATSEDKKEAKRNAAQKALETLRDLFEDFGKTKTRTEF